MIRPSQNRIAIAAVSSALLLAACADENTLTLTIDPSARPDLVANVLGKVQFAGLDATVLKDTELPSASAEQGAPTFSFDQTQATVQSGTRVSFPFVVDSDLAITALFAKVAGSPDLFQVDVPESSAKVANPFSLGFDLPTSVGNGTFCIDFAATNSGGLSGRAPQPFCINVNGVFSPTPEPTATPTQEPATTPTAAATPPPPAPTNAPTQSPTAAPTQAPTSAPTQAPSATPAPTAEPTPAPSTAPTASPSVSPTPATGGGGSASACYNPTLATEGTQITLTYNSTDGGSGGEVDFTDERTVGGNTTFDGRTAQVTTGTTTSTVSGAGAADGTSVTDTTTYAQVNASAPSTNAIGVHTESDISAAGASGRVITDSTIRPGRQMRFDLQAGDSYSQTFTTETTTSTSFGGFPGQETSTSIDSSVVTRYVGRSTISVPAGTFEVCRFEVETTDSGSGSTAETSTEYFAVGSGVLVMQQSGDTTTQLVGGSINGGALR